MAAAVAYHAGADEVLDGLLDHAHVDAAGEVHVLGEDVAVAVLLGSPGARPDRPGAGAGAGLVAHAVERVDHGLVRGQRLLRDHVAHQHDEVLVGQPRGARAELADLVLEHLGRRVRQEVRRLPAVLHGLEQRQQRPRRPAFQGPEHLRLLRRHRVRHAGARGGRRHGHRRRGHAAPPAARAGRRHRSRTGSRGACADGHAVGLHRRGSAALRRTRGGGGSR